MGKPATRDTNQKIPFASKSEISFCCPEDAVLLSLLTAIKADFEGEPADDQTFEISALENEVAKQEKELEHITILSQIREDEEVPEDLFEPTDTEPTDAGPSDPQQLAIETPTTAAQPIETQPAVEPALAQPIKTQPTESQQVDAQPSLPTNTLLDDSQVENCEDKFVGFSQAENVVADAPNQQDKPSAEHPSSQLALPNPAVIHTGCVEPSNAQAPKPATEPKPKSLTGLRVDSGSADPSNLSEPVAESLVDLSVFYQNYVFRLFGNSMCS